MPAGKHHRRPKYLRLFPYYGSKVRLGAKYPAPEHDTIVEPFAGAAGYSCHHYERRVVLCEKDPVVFAVLDYLLQSNGEDIARLPLLGPLDCVDDLPICQPAKWLIGFWINNGTSAPCKRPSAWMRSLYPDIPSKFWGERCRDRLAEHVDIIRGGDWSVVNASFQSIGNIRATWYVDPPYQNAGKYYKQNGIDYEELSQWCRSRDGQTIVCENEGATWLPFVRFCETRGAAKGRKPSTEVIWTNDGQQHIAKALGKPGIPSAPR
jgi:hypothetical protein